MDNYTYIVKCSDGTLYTGWTNDLEKRIQSHNEGKGAKYTKTRTPVTLVYYETFPTKQEAMKREYAIKQMRRKEKEKLIAEGIAVSDSIQVGIMIEIPAAAVLADQFAKEVDFFSIGTNDLIQYTLAADRMSSGVSYLYQPFNPSILRLVKHVIDSAHKEGKWAGMCGEMAGEPLAAPLLLGLGLDEFSMSATSILSQRKLIRGLSQAEMAELANKAINCGTMEEVVELVEAATK